ncbi:hypothetical protein [Cohnella terricola]|uniref:ABC transporter periplasmic binding protein yphF n=1 Tax=Cohnella terricola TaxID=1289167 RepID=A0A559JXI9_9BACL|nr:hypothetical protein [Cohnella terricola]TVY04557.1 hypothetical protein FPZ45_03005 [Cohnella terricola]
MIVRLLPKALAAVLASLALLLLAGCMYPEDQSPGNNASAREAVLTVQDAVDRYREQTGLLPIQNADETIPQYEKYKVDFGKLKRLGYVSQVPGAAFESGGAYQFLIIDEETNPLVRLLDLTVFQSVAGVQKKVDEYRAGHANRNPAGDEVYPGFASVDFSKLGMKSLEIRSMYSRQTLNLLVDEAGQVFVDYGIDIATALNKAEVKPGANEDLRRMLIDASYFVPVRSPAYQLVNGEPTAVRS